ncbi:hypothetical protein ABE485_29065 [Achromobacter spanius]|uniref:SCO4402 family protein n=1 Tax=Achromobacter spanius TaxID=217203 RepID=UPI00320A9AD8
MEELEFNELRSPSMRRELIDYLRGLSDACYQHCAWVEHKYPIGGYDELDYAIHFLYDDTKLAKDPGATVGSILKNREEVDCIEILIEKLNLIFFKYGLGLTDGEYIEKPEWREVIQAAANAKSCLEK